MTELDLYSTSDEWAYAPGHILHEVMGGWRYPGVVGKVARARVPLEFPKIWRIAQARTQRPVKFGVVSAQVAASVLEVMTAEYDRDKRELMWDMAVAFNEELRELVAAGCKVIQTEDPIIHFVSLGNPDREYLDFLVEVFNRELEGLDDAEIWIHTCWGNPNMQRVLDGTSYAAAIEIYLERLKGDVWTVEMKDRNQQDIELLAPYKDSMKKKVAIGVVSHRQLQVETPEEVTQQVRNALRYQLSLRIQGTRPPTSSNSSMNGGSGATGNVSPSTEAVPPPTSTTTVEPGPAASTASALAITGRPRLMQLRMKMRAKLRATTQRIPAACIAMGTFSRDEPVPKFAPATRIVSPPSCARREGSSPSNRWRGISAGSSTFRNFPG